MKSGIRVLTYTYYVMPYLCLIYALIVSQTIPSLSLIPRLIGRTVDLVYS